MATQVQRRRGTTAQHAAFTGALAETTIDTTKNTVVVHDGATAGGIPLATEASVTAHLSDTTDAHDASAISIVDAGAYFTATDVEAALQELGAVALTSGDYTPTVFNGANVSSSTLVKASYIQVGNVVTVAIAVSLTTTAANTPTTVGFSLPVASNFTNVYDAIGTIGSSLDDSAITLLGHCEADTTNDRLYIKFECSASFIAVVTAMAQYVVL